LEAFVKKEIFARKVRLTMGAFRFFIDYISNYDADPGDPKKKFGADRGWMTVHALDRIAMMQGAMPMTDTELRALIPWTQPEIIWDISQAIADGRGNLSGVRALETALTQFDPGHIFNSMAYRVSGISALALANYDVAVKSGKLEVEAALTAFVLGEKWGTANF